jgi:two-component system, NarL family, nitrate/nitrite response regulator NarL
MTSRLATTAAFVETRAITVVIADDHGLFRAGLRGLLEGESGFQVVGEAANGIDAVDVVQALKPDVLLLDLCLAERSGSGLDVLRALARPPQPQSPALSLPHVHAPAHRTRTIVLTDAIDDGQTIEALLLGAQGILLKDSAPPLLFQSVRAVANGQCWLGRECVTNLVRHLQTMKVTAHDERRRTAFGLTTRERQVVSAIVDGSTNRDIAQRFAVSADTVKHHLTNIFDKCGVSNRLELALFAVHHRLVDTM